MDRRDFMIGTLSTTAVVLFVGLMLLESRPTPAFGDGMSISGGGYLLTVGAVARTDEEVVYVIDLASERMASYRFDTARREIRLTQGLDLGEIQRTAEQRASAKATQPKP